MFLMWPWSQLITDKLFSVNQIVKHLSMFKQIPTNVDNTGAVFIITHSICTLFYNHNFKVIMKCPNRRCCAIS